MSHILEPPAALSSQDLIALEERHGAHNYHPLEIVITRGEGVWVWDVEGNRYLDFLAAYSAVNQGHCHPRLVQALTRQAQRLTLCSRAFRNDQLGQLCQEISALTGYDRFLPMNSGAEAVETAIKLARKWGQTVKGVPADEAEILVFDNNFHGRTTTIVGFSSSAQYREGFGPFAGGYRLLPFGDAAAVAAAMTERTVAVLVEPIQGEAGIVVPPAGYLAQLREITTRHRALLLADEIQSGLGRTGRLFAFEHDGIRPDLVTVGKALSGGFYPVSGILADSALMNVFKPGDHGSTFGGNPLACRAARAVLEVIQSEDLAGRAAATGQYLLDGFRQRLAGVSGVTAIRGCGLMLGIELDRPCPELVAQALAQGLLINVTADRVIRLLPPLILEQAQADLLLDGLGELVRGWVAGQGQQGA